MSTRRRAPRGGRARGALLAALAALVVLVPSACRSVDVTPASLRSADAPAHERERALAVWRAAVERANAFLASPLRRTLPAGTIELADDGMRLRTEHGAWPLRVRCTTWGDLCVRTGFAAQEREDGFVVGAAPPGRDPRTDNSLFRTSEGEPHDAGRIARLVLHEATHVVYREGTVGTWNTIAYYAEAIFLLRAASHSAERKAHATSEEFTFFAMLDAAPEDERVALSTWIDAHLAQRAGKRCRHGPFEVPEAPLASASRTR